MESFFLMASVLTTFLFGIYVGVFAMVVYVEYCVNNYGVGFFAIEWREECRQDPGFVVNQSSFLQRCLQAIANRTSSDEIRHRCIDLMDHGSRSEIYQFVIQCHRDSELKRKAGIMNWERILTREWGQNDSD